MAEATFVPIVGTLIYVWDHDTDQVLIIRRNARPDDDHYGKVNGVGGKVDADESVLAGMRRELHEEVGIEMTAGRFRGTITWTNFGPKREQWLGFMFVVDAYSGEAATSNPEGTLEWVDRSRLLEACDPPGVAELPMWPGDRHFLPMIFDDDPRPFWGTMPYDGLEPIGWSYERF